MAGDEISSLGAASGVVAIDVDGLLARGTVDLLGEDGDPESVVHGCAKSLRHENGVEAVMLGGQGCDEPARVRLSAAAKALGFPRLASFFCFLDERLMHLHVERERGC